MMVGLASLRFDWHHFWVCFGVVRGSNVGGGGTAAAAQLCVVNFMTHLANGAVHMKGQQQRERAHGAGVDSRKKAAATAPLPSSPQDPPARRRPKRSKV